MTLPIISQAEFDEKLKEHALYLQANREGVKDNPYEGISYNNVVLQNLLLEQANLSNMGIFNSVVQNVTFKDCNLDFSYFYYNAFRNCSFQYCGFRKAEILDDSFVGCSFLDCDFNKTEFSGNDCRYANFIGCSFRNIVLGGGDYRYATFTDSTFERSMLYKSKLYNPIQQQVRSLGDLAIVEVSIDIHGEDMIHNGLASIQHILVEKG